MKIKSATSIKGRRSYMEDSASFIEKDDVSVGIVCDGHGGEGMSKRCTKELPIELLKISKIENNPITRAITIKDILLNYGENSKRSKSGTTATGIVTDSNFVYIFNIGDSRTSVHLKPGGILYHLKPNFIKGKPDTFNLISYQTSFFTTVDHDPDLDEEVKRISQTDGVLTEGRLNGILNVTRTFGDNGVGPGLDFTPDVYIIEKKDVTGPIFSYTDGLYELFKNDKSLEKKHELYHLAEKFGTDAIVSHMYGSGSEDNITAILFEI